MHHSRVRHISVARWEMIFQRDSVCVRERERARVRESLGREELPPPVEARPHVRSVTALPPARQTEKASERESVCVFVRVSERERWRESEAGERANEKDMMTQGMLSQTERAGEREGDGAPSAPVAHHPQVFQVHPGGNPGAKRWFVWSTPTQMLPRRGSICGRLT